MSLIEHLKSKQNNLLCRETGKHGVFNLVVHFLRIVAHFWRRIANQSDRCIEDSLEVATL